jgi:hypothetical protein
MNFSWKAWLALAAIALVAAFFWGGRYTVVGQGNLIFIVDRFTGAVRSCQIDGCKPLATKEAIEQWPGVRVEPKKGMFDDIPSENKK